MIQNRFTNVTNSAVMMRMTIISFIWMAGGVVVDDVYFFEGSVVLVMLFLVQWICLLQWQWLLPLPLLLLSKLEWIRVIDIWANLLALFLLLIELLVVVVASVNWMTSLFSGLSCFFVYERKFWKHSEINMDYLKTKYRNNKILLFSWINYSL